MKNNIILICIFSLTLTFSVYAADTNINNDPFLKEKLNKANWEPKGEFYPSDFSVRGDIIYNRWGEEISRVVKHTQQTGNILIQHADIKGNFGYSIDLRRHHPIDVHSPFDVTSYSEGEFSNEKDLDLRQTQLNLKWNGYFNHPADGYDGDGGTGARDDISFSITGDASGHYYNPTSIDVSSNTNSINLYFRNVTGSSYNHSFLIFDTQYGEKYYIGGGPSEKGDKLVAYAERFNKSTLKGNTLTPGDDFNAFNGNLKNRNVEPEETKPVIYFTDNPSDASQTFLGKYIKAIEFVKAINSSNIEYEALNWYDDGGNEGNSNSVAYQTISAIGEVRPAGVWHAPGSGVILNINSNN